MFLNDELMRADTLPALATGRVLLPRTMPVTQLDLSISQGQK